MITHRHLQTLGDQITTRLSSAFATRAVELAEEAHLTGTPHLVEFASTRCSSGFRLKTARASTAPSPTGPEACGVSVQ